MEVIKRDGTLEEYDGSKVIMAILKSMVATDIDELYHPIADIIEEEISNEIFSSEYNWTIKDINDYIQNRLVDFSMKNVAFEFSEYRNKKADKIMIDGKVKYVEDYKNSANASTGSKFDSNANVEHKNIATLFGELHKRESILLNRKLLTDKIKLLYGNDLAEEYIRQLKSHEIYKHDETSIMPYCVSINMYPFLTEGLGKLGGHSTPPTHLQSFSGSFINLVFAVASQFAGAVATPEYLMYMDYFIRKEYGDNYISDKNRIVVNSNRPRTIEKVIEDSFQQVVYSLNQPAAARNYQSIFWNIGYFDKYYFESMFGNFYFPDGTQPKWDTLNWLQKKFMKWFNAERTKAVLTFPVETMAMLTENGDIKDEEYADFTSLMYSEGHSFFTYLSESADSLSSCCRLRNEIADNEFSFSLGAGGVATGSKSVITININRLVQDTYADKIKNKKISTSKQLNVIGEAVRSQVLKVHKYQTAFNEIMKDNFNSRLLPVYDANFISLNKQFLTVGINGLVEAAEFMNIPIKADSEDYKSFIDSILKPIYEENKNAKTKELMFNTEFVPAENLGVKHANWDRQDGYFVPRDVYNSYFYIVEDDSCNLIDKFKLHGKDSIQFLDGGSALHANLQEHLSKEQYRKLLKVASQTGCNYFTFNIPNTVCNECGYISKHIIHECPSCGTEDLDYITRVIGYLKRVSSFSIQRQAEESRRYYGDL